MKDWITEIEHNWDRFVPAEEPPVHRSAVLLPLVQDRDGQTCVLFEHRAKDLDVQPDEICFPGGGVEEGETPLEAAVRETQEELLVGKEQIRILGETEGVSRNGIIRIHAYVGILDGYRGTYSREEVDHIFMVPIDWFLQNPPETYMTTVTTVPEEPFPYERIPGGRNYPWRNQKTPVYFYRYPGEVIWGLTAGILYRFTQKLQELDGRKTENGENA